MPKVGETLLAASGRYRQARETLFRAKARDGTFRVCALGLLCMEDGVSIARGQALLDNYALAALGEYYDTSFRVRKYACPAKSCSRPYSGILGNMIMHLNDLHRWSFKRIGEWLVEKGV